MKNITLQNITQVACQAVENNFDIMVICYNYMEYQSKYFQKKVSASSMVIIINNRCLPACEKIVTNRASVVTLSQMSLA